MIDLSTLTRIALLLESNNLQEVSDYLDSLDKELLDELIEVVNGD